MGPEETANKLKALRDKILNDLTGMTDQLVTNDSVGFDALLTVARATGKTELLEKALQKAESLDDSSDKAGALLDLLDEVELSLSNAEQNESSSPPEEDVSASIDQAVSN